MGRISISTHLISTKSTSVKSLEGYYLEKEVKICQDLELAAVDIVLLAGIQVVVLEADIMLADQVVLQEAHLLTEVPTMHHYHHTPPPPRRGYYGI